MGLQKYVSKPKLSPYLAHIVCLNNSSLLYVSKPKLTPYLAHIFCLHNSSLLLLLAILLSIFQNVFPYFLHSHATAIFTLHAPFCL
jgi:hypothetical protein